MRSTADRPQCCAMSVALVDQGEIVPRRGTTRTRSNVSACPGSPASSSRPSTLSSTFACALLKAGPCATCNGGAEGWPEPLPAPSRGLREGAGNGSGQPSAPPLQVAHGPAFSKAQAKVLDKVLGLDEDAGEPGQADTLLRVLVVPRLGTISPGPPRLPTSRSIAACPLCCASSAVWCITWTPGMAGL